MQILKPNEAQVSPQLHVKIVQEMNGTVKVDASTVIGGVRTPAPLLSVMAACISAANGLLQHLAKESSMIVRPAADKPNEKSAPNGESDAT